MWKTKPTISTKVEDGVKDKTTCLILDVVYNEEIILFSVVAIRTVFHMHHF